VSRRLPRPQFPSTRKEKAHRPPKLAARPARVAWLKRGTGTGTRRRSADTTRSSFRWRAPAPPPPPRPPRPQPLYPTPKPPILPSYACAEIYRTAHGGACPIGTTRPGFFVEDVEDFGQSDIMAGRCGRWRLRCCDGWLRRWSACTTRGGRSTVPRTSHPEGRPSSWPTTPMACSIRWSSGFVRDARSGSWPRARCGAIPSGGWPWMLSAVCRSTGVRMSPSTSTVSPWLATRRPSPDVAPSWRRERSWRSIPRGPPTRTRTSNLSSRGPRGSPCRRPPRVVRRRS